MSDLSSTRMISLRRWSGERSRTECTVLRSTDQASLWKQMITEVEGNSVRNRFGALHLRSKHQSLKKD